ncbi:molybdate ABC transporter permease subunit [Desulfosarcina sp. OttesenSCG-928-A07]|nr:molybdate ABC transporter permease subunit [Desulfosarcina sp. OttesenSCG-928-G17]MDL2329463.1 molybdate ABC transporter permease subunit [Desulfosarcina sp. OttesenSCG-928-A07]
MNFFALTGVEQAALFLSLRVSGWAVVISLPLGVFAAWILARLRFPGKGLVDGIIHLPLVLPPIVTGYLLLVFLGRNGMIGKPLYDWFGIQLAFNWKGAVVASAVMAFPLMVRAIRLSLENVDQGLEDAARTLGAGPLGVFFTVTVPLITPGIITGLIVAFARSLGEFGATIAFVSNIPGHTQTLPLALYTLTQTPDGEAGAMRLCIISIGIAMAALLGSDLLSRRFALRIRG